MAGIESSGRTRFSEYAQSIRFVFSTNQIWWKSVNRGLLVLDQARALDPCHRPEGSWALGTRMAVIVSITWFSTVIGSPGACHVIGKQSRGCNCIPVIGYTRDLPRNYARFKLSYTAATWTGPLRTKLANQNINWEQRMAPFFVNGPMKLENRNNGLTTKFWNPTKLRRVADLSGNVVTFWLVRFDPFFFFLKQSECGRHKKIEKSSTP